MFFELKFIAPPIANCVSKIMMPIGKPTKAEILTKVKNETEKFLMSNPLSTFENLKKLLISFRIGTPNICKSGINPNNIKVVVKTKASLDVRMSPSSFALSRRRWDGSSVFSCPSSFSAILHTSKHFCQKIDLIDYQVKKRMRQR